MGGFKLLLQDGQLALARQLVGNNDEVTDLRLLSLPVGGAGVCNTCGAGGRVRQANRSLAMEPLLKTPVGC